MKFPLKLGAARNDPKNGGEFYIVMDAEGAWIGDIRAEHAPEIIVRMNAVQPEAAPRSDEATWLDGAAQATGYSRWWIHAGRMHLERDGEPGRIEVLRVD